MPINSLGYVGIRSRDLEEWQDFAENLLGMQSVESGNYALAFRMDDYKQRLMIETEPGDALGFLGWEVDSKEDLEIYAKKLDSQNIPVAFAPKELADKRFVDQMILFQDPEGNRIELFWNPMLDKEKFKPGRPISGFKTGPYGMGHAVLHAKDVDLLVKFYCDILDFKVSDYGLSPYPMHFFHVNGRHHSFAILGTKLSGFHHFMVEFNNLDDVGQGYDLACLEEDRIAYTLGRHTNDYMTSFYAKTPSGFFIESGWGGRIIDTDLWEPHETNVGPSFWGHDRPYLDEDTRKSLKDMRLKAASDGLQAPLLVDCPWLYGLQDLKK